eukprot:m.201962 g.201962  ORF g.201962 m.201962 type:complete len:1174 (+) comp32808_c0_seq1:142-3663(+)
MASTDVKPIIVIPDSDDEIDDHDSDGSGITLTPLRSTASSNNVTSKHEIEPDGCFERVTKKPKVENDKGDQDGKAEGSTVAADSKQGIQDDADADTECDVCRSGESVHENPIVICDGCGIGVHCWCFGISTEDLPEGDWFCDVCDPEVNLSGQPSPSCCVCPKKRGIMMSVSSKKPQFCHVVCAIALMTDGHPVRINKNGIGNINATVIKDSTKRCCVCDNATSSAVQCNYHDAIGELQPHVALSQPCQRLMHPLCAREAGFHTEVDTVTGMFVVFCADHSSSRALLKYTGCRDRRLRQLQKPIESDEVDGSPKKKSIKVEIVEGVAERRQFFLSQNWDLFRPFLPNKMLSRDSTLARKCLGRFANEKNKDKRPPESGYVLPTKQPKHVIGGEMREYQLEGLRWLMKQHGHGIGGILGDEMGLGKTLQVCAFLGHLKSELLEGGPYLVVAPLSVIDTWVRELKHWVPSLIVVMFHGSEKERTRLKATTAARGAFDVLVTSYETLIADTQMFHPVHLQFRYLVLDEAHRIKNYDTLVGKAVRRVHTQGKLLLTGTPLQNNLTELWTLLNFLFPEVLVDNTLFDVERTDKEAMVFARNLLEPLMLRRTKKSIGLKIPPKTEVKVLAPLSPVQLEWYEKVLAHDAGLLSNLGKLSGGCAQDFTRLANMVMQLRKVSSHPWLLPGAEPAECIQSGTDDRIVTSSGKLVILDKLLSKIQAQGRKVVIFSQFTKVLDVIDDYLRYRKFGFFRLDGQTAAAKRRYIMAQFADPERLSAFVFIVSTRAGGLGLNLQTANTVVLFDNDWNPQADLQAQDRVHRMGQKNPVTVYRFISEGTCEERIVKYAEEKLKLSQTVLQDDKRGLLGVNKDANDMSDIKQQDLVDMVRFGANKRQSSIAAFHALCDMSIDDILEKKQATVVDEVEWNGDTRNFMGMRTTSNNSKNTYEEWSMSHADKTRDKQSTTVAEKVEGMGEMAVSKWSLELAKYNEDMERRAAEARAERLAVAERRKTAPRIPFCTICRQPHGVGLKDKRVTCRLCPAVAHIKCCSNVANAFIGWKCPQHVCCLCGRSGTDSGGLLLRCVDCSRSICSDCLPDGFKAVPEGDAALNRLGWTRGGVEFIRCPPCTKGFKSTRMTTPVSLDVFSRPAAEPNVMFYARYMSKCWAKSDLPWTPVAPDNK